MNEYPILKPVGDLIAQVGFPIFVTCWILARTDKRMDRLAEIMSKIEVSMAKIEEHLSDD